jgi:ankyrin repeat protein
MSLESVFNQPTATEDLARIVEAHATVTDVDDQSEAFASALELAIRNGDEFVFARLLKQIPKLVLNKRCPPLESTRASPLSFKLWRIAKQIVVGIITDAFFRVAYYYTLSYSLQQASLRCCCGIGVASARLYDHLHSSPSPFSLWIWFLMFNGLKQRFSRKFLFASLDAGLVFLLLAIATRLVSRSSWIGDCLHEGHSALASYKGIQTRILLDQFMPSLRRVYFAIVLGPGHYLAQSLEPQKLPPKRGHGEVILRQLMRFQQNDSALMLQYLDAVIFEDINENSGAGHEILMWASNFGRIDVVQKVLNLGIDVNISKVNDDPYCLREMIPPGTALFWAASGGFHNVVELLLRYDAHQEHIDSRTSPLIGATQGSHRVYDVSKMVSYTKCVAQLLKKRGDPNAVDQYGRSALSWSVQPTQKPTLDLLLDYGADANILDQKLRLPLHYAAEFGRSDAVVRALLPKTADAASEDKDGTSALTLAIWSADCPPTIKLLLNATPDVNLGGGPYGSPLGAASRYCSSKSMRMLLLDRGADPNVVGTRYGSPLMAMLHRPFNESTLQDNILGLELLLASGADVHAKLADGKQALHVASEHCYRAEIFEILIHHGADVNAHFLHCKKGQIEVTTTPLGILCDFYVREEAAMLLLRKGADVNCLTPSGKTVLQAACSILGSSKVACELIAKGARVNERSAWHGDTALHSAATAAKSELIGKLLEKGADVNARDQGGRTPLHDVCWRTSDEESQQKKVKNPFEARSRQYRLKVESELMQSIKTLLTLGKADPIARDEDGATPLHHAVKACNPISVETLIRSASKPLIFETDSKGRLPLHWAGEAGFTEFFIDSHPNFQAMSGLEGEEKMRTAMLAVRNYINTTDHAGNTPFHYAAEKGHENFIATLLLCRAFMDVDLRNHEGFTALDLAKKNNHMWVVAQLKEAEISFTRPSASEKEDEKAPEVVRKESNIELTHNSEDTTWNWTAVSDAGSQSDDESFARRNEEPSWNWTAVSDAGRHSDAESIE